MSLELAAIAQLVERIHGKDEVSGSSPDRGSRMLHQHIASPLGDVLVEALNYHEYSFNGLSH